MSGTVPRTCTVIAELPASQPGDPQSDEPDSRPLRDFRSCRAYVLLGDPGAGKTTAFEDEVGELNDCAHLVSARDFLAIEEPDSVPSGHTIFIDGLDEVRAGQRDARSPFDMIRRRLRDLGRPRFRLSCRESDWLGENDRRHLARVSPGGEVTVLRLDPLTESDIRRVVDGHASIADPGDFLSEGHERGVGGLLANPQTLIMLADVVGGGGDWPTSRADTFEKACLHIVREHNEEHLAAAKSRDVPPPGELLDAAGRLCAVQLLTGAPGYSLLGNGGDSDYLLPDQCGYEPPGFLRHALATKLFRGQSHGRATPIHRQVAEYLAARHLARVVEHDRLPARRLVALMAGRDGSVVTEMRGLSAWLAAHSPKVRPHLIDRDPVGVGQYGDVSAFGTEGKRALLESLGRAIPKLEHWGFGLGTAFRALATPELEQAFAALLASPSRADEHQRLVIFALRVLRGSPALPGLSNALLLTVRDPSWYPAIRINALRVYSRRGHGSDGKTNRLRALLDGIGRGDVPDPDDELLGVLLGQLYPDHLTPRELWDVFSEPQNPHLLGTYRHFWEMALAERVPDAHLAEHLDILARWPRLLPSASSETDPCERLRLDLVARGLSQHGDDLFRRGDVARLYDWLGVACADHAIHRDGHRRSAKSIREWLEDRPQVQKAVVLECLRRQPDAADPYPPQRSMHERLCASDLPRDFGTWCLNRAVRVANGAPDTATHLLELAFSALGDDRHNQGLSLDRIRETTRDSELLTASLARLERSRIAWKREDAEWADRRRRYEQEEADKREKELAYLRSQAASLRANEAPPALLYQLARTYFGDFQAISGDKEAGARAIWDRWPGERELTDAILASFRGVASRPDLPSLKEVAAVARKNRIHYLALPLLAGLAEEERTSSGSPELPTGKRRMAIASYFATVHAQYCPGWYTAILDRHPEIVAEVQLRLAPAVFRGNNSVNCKLYGLAHDPGYATVARLSALKLLRAFPTQAKRQLGHDLQHLLIAALEHCDRGELVALIDSKLSRSSLGVWQRTVWLAAGLLARPEAYRAAVRDHVQGRERRLAELFDFLSCPGNQTDRLDDDTVALLVSLLGGSVEPQRLEVRSRAYVITAAMERSELVAGLIQRLASSTSPQAGDLLQDLINNPSLAPWRDHLRKARRAQRIVHRDHRHRHPDAGQVRDTLRGAAPANVADLAALLEEYLRELARQIESGDADGWRPFWNEDKHRRQATPKAEESCRDAILRELRHRLPPGVEVQPEARHARGNRSDLRASYLGADGRRFHVPVEIKRSQHPAVWTSIEGQLIGKYAIDPVAEGHGVYLVLWFGREHRKRSPSGEHARGAADLERRLRSTLSDRRKRKIAVCVIDVSGTVGPRART